MFTYRRDIHFRTSQYNKGRHSSTATSQAVTLSSKLLGALMSLCVKRRVCQGYDWQILRRPTALLRMTLLGLARKLAPMPGLRLRRLHLTPLKQLDD